MNPKQSGKTDLEMLRQKGLDSLYPEKTKIMVGMSTCGIASGAKEVYWKFVDGLTKKSKDAIVVPTGCIGYCQMEPLVDVSIPGLPRTVYSHIDVDKADELLKTVVAGQIKAEWVLGKIDSIESPLVKEAHDYPNTRENENNLPNLFEIPFYKKQIKIALRNCGFINPDSMEEYVARGGYAALFKVLTKMNPKKVIQEVKDSGLRGRGGGGFPTGQKWELCRNSAETEKYIICNADEGDPGAYMDRSVLEGDPHSVIEGMIIGAYAIGAQQGFIYVRGEYPLAVEKLQQAVTQAEDLGFLGNQILGTDFSFTLQIVRGGGAFVCGEETALMASIEGRIGEPHPRPPYPAEKGLWGKPTNINNVETWANIPAILAKGASWFSSIGSGSSKGTKVFSLVGNVQNTGLVEVPMGIPLEEIIYDIGGGIPDGERLKAVQTGGPSGGCIPLDSVKIPVDYEHLSEIGSIMGSGGMVVMDGRTCMVDIARYFLRFTQNESCGKCTPCREGTKRMLEILTHITEGRGKEGDIELLEQLAQTIIDGSLCALGGTAPNPVLSTIRHFRQEYEEHIKYKRCPAIRCKDIIFTPCKYNCPVETDVPTFIAYIAKGEYHKAFDVIKENNPMPTVCGYVCHHPCEDRCRSVEGSQPMSIKGLKRYVGDKEIRRGYRPFSGPKHKRNEKVAIIGAGPAGLACAFDLRQQGYSVTVFDELDTLGGMLWSAIPEYRLPDKVLQTEIKAILNTGIQVQKGVRIGKDPSIEELFRMGFRAVFIATGAHQPLKLNIPGEDSEGCLDALDFLKKEKCGEVLKIGRKVAVIGGGNAAIDAARSVWRMGSDVSLIYRRTRAEMPAIFSEVKEGEDEGIDFTYLTAPLRILTENGRVKALDCIRMELGDFDSSGRRRPLPVEGSEFTLEIDTLLPAVGQVPDLSFLNGNTHIRKTERGTIKVDWETLATDMEGVFAGGDVVTGPSTIADSLAQGKIAAVSIDQYIKGEPMTREYTVTQHCVHVDPVSLTKEESEQLFRPQMPTLTVEDRKNNFEMVDLGFTEDLARMEAKRCLRCDMKSYI